MNINLKELKGTDIKHLAELSGMGIIHNGFFEMRGEDDDKPCGCLLTILAVNKKPILKTQLIKYESMYYPSDLGAFFELPPDEDFSFFKATGFPLGLTHDEARSIVGGFDHEKPYLWGREDPHLTELYNEGYRLRNELETLRAFYDQEEEDAR